MKLLKRSLILFVIFLIFHHCHAHDGDALNSDSSGASEVEDSNNVQSEKRGITGSKKWDKVSQKRCNIGKKVFSLSLRKPNLP